MTLSNTAAVVNAIRYTVKARGTWQTFVTENNITHDMIAATAKELAILAYPSDDQVQTVKDDDGKQTRTRFGNAVQAAGNGMRSVLNKDGSTDTVTAALLTKAGREATLAEVTAAWHASQK